MCLGIIHLSRGLCHDVLETENEAFVFGFWGNGKEAWCGWAMFEKGSGAQNQLEWNGPGVSLKENLNGNFGSRNRLWREHMELIKRVSDRDSFKTSPSFDSIINRDRVVRKKELEWEGRWLFWGNAQKWRWTGEADREVGENKGRCPHHQRSLKGSGRGWSLGRPVNWSMRRFIGRPWEIAFSRAVGVEGD